MQKVILILYISVITGISYWVKIYNGICSLICFLFILIELEIVFKVNILIILYTYIIIIVNIKE